MIALRDYQQQSIDAVLDYWRRGGGNPLVEMATGLGKSVVIGEMTRSLLAQYPDMRVLMLVHVKELVQQNAAALLKVWPGAPLGIYSAGLRRRDTHKPILFASIQSVFRQDGYSLGHQDLVLIDEAHLVPSAGEGMYRTLLDKLRNTRPDMRVAGFTATPFRLDSGRLDQGSDRLFDEVVYSYGIAKGIADGWLSPLISKASMAELDVSGVARRGGEFIAGELERAVDLDPVTQAAVDEMMRFGEARKSWLVFCAGVQHAHHVREAVQSRGVSCATVTGETPSHERAHAIAEFKAGRLRCLTNANVLTTGFDAPSLDMIAMLRPTLSTGLYVQMCGRGTRLADGKDNCLVLDFAGVVRRHGPVDTIEVGGKKGALTKDVEPVKPETVRAKECPVCHSLNPINVGTCRDCGHEWPVEDKPKHDRTADAETPILSNEASLSRQAKRMMPDDHPVLDWSASRHTKLGSPDSLRVTYLAGLMQVSEWVCLEHTGWPLQKAQAWWAQHGGGSAPASIEEAIGRFDELRRPDIVQTRKNGQWWEIVGRRFEQSQEEGRAA